MARGAAAGRAQRRRQAAAAAVARDGGPLVVRPQGKLPRYKTTAGGTGPAGLNQDSVISEGRTSAFERSVVRPEDAPELGSFVPQTVQEHASRRRAATKEAAHAREKRRRREAAEAARLRVELAGAPSDSDGEDTGSDDEPGTARRRRMRRDQLRQPSSVLIAGRWNARQTPHRGDPRGDGPGALVGRPGSPEMNELLSTLNNEAEPMLAYAGLSVDAADVMGAGAPYSTLDPAALAAPSLRGGDGGGSITSAPSSVISAEASSRMQRSYANRPGTVGAPPTSAIRVTAGPPAVSQGSWGVDESWFASRELDGPGSFGRSWQGDGGDGSRRPSAARPATTGMLGRRAQSSGRFGSRGGAVASRSSGDSNSASGSRGTRAAGTWSRHGGGSMDTISLAGHGLGSSVQLLARSAGPRMRSVPGMPAAKRGEAHLFRRHLHSRHLGMARSGQLARSAGPPVAFERQRVVTHSVLAPASLVSPPLPVQLRPAALARGNVRAAAVRNAPHFMARYSQRKGADAFASLRRERECPHTRSVSPSRLGLGLERDVGFGFSSTRS